MKPPQELKVKILKPPLANDKPKPKETRKKPNKKLVVPPNQPTIYTLFKKTKPSAKPPYQVNPTSKEAPNTRAENRDSTEQTIAARTEGRSGSQPGCLDARPRPLSHPQITLDSTASRRHLPGKPDLAGKPENQFQIIFNKNLEDNNESDSDRI